MQDLLIRSLGHRLDWKTSRKLLVFESDDWGSLYLPHKHHIHSLEQAGILQANRTGYLLYDCLEKSDDLQSLFDLLSQYSDIHGNPARFTFNTVMGNPDFEKIRESGFREYFLQHFFDSYVQYNEEDCRKLWTDGMAARLFTPQFHAREHVNVPRWMGDLQCGREDTLIAFEKNYYCLTRSTKSPVDYLTAYWPDSVEQLREIKKITADGLNSFEETFGCKSNSFVACCFVLPEEVECLTSDYGVKLIQTQRRHRAPIAGENDSFFRTHYSGQTNRCGQTYSVRNVIFEPALDESIEWSDLAFQQIVDAFKRRVPAVVSTHRVNFVGGRDLKNRERSLKILGSLLKKLILKFPDIEFLSSDELLSAVRPIRSV